MKQLAYSLLFVIGLGARAGNNPVLLSAQTDFKKANAYYDQNRNLSMDTYYMVFSEHDSQSLLEGKNGKFMTYNGNGYTLIDDIEIYRLKDKIISINKEDKLISVGDNNIEPLSPLQTDVDSLLTLCSRIEVEQVNPNEKKYKLYFSDDDVPEFTRVDVHIDTRNYRYTRLVLYYAMAINLKADFYAEEKQPRLEIYYKNVRVLAADPMIFNQSLYITDSNGKLGPAAKYASYKVSDLRNQTRIKKR
jgi:hypothetical protein